MELEDRIRKLEGDKERMLNSLRGIEIVMKDMEYQESSDVKETVQKWIYDIKY